MQPSDAKVNILMVDDYPENLLALEAILTSGSTQLVKANSGQEALRCLLNQDFAVILLDVQMPEMDGFETATLIRSRARSRNTPIIFLTAFSTSEQLMFKGYSLGAVDYLHKPIDPVILTSKVSVFVELFKKTEAVKRQAAQLEDINRDLRRSEEQFRSLSACSPMGIFVTDIEGMCTYTNPRAQATWGLITHELLTEQWRSVLHPEDQDWMLQGWQAYLETMRDYSAEFRVRARDEFRWVHVRSAPMLSDQGEPLGHVGTVEDVTERKQAEEVRHQMVREQAARQEAEAASRMKDEFLAVLSHELRTPLNSMLGWSRLLRSKKFDETTTMRALETIERNATAQSRLIEDILDVSQIIRGKLRLTCGPVSLVTVIEAAIEAVRPQAAEKQLQFSHTLCKAGLEIDPQTAGAAFSVWGDAVRLQQIVWNLLSNAIKFTPEQGRVHLRMEHKQVDPALTSLIRSPHSPPPPPFALHASNLVEIQVSDNGVGISPDFLPSVFDRFRQADSTTTRSHNGLGLGLAIVRYLVDTHGGTIQAASPGEGQGATFTVYLPLLDRQDLPQETTTTERSLIQS